MPHRSGKLFLACVLAALAVAPYGGAAAAAADAEPFPPVVSADWLAQNLKDPGLTVVDARPSVRDYLSGHIPGAQILTGENVRSAAGGVPAEILPGETMSVLLGRLGITKETRVVVYSSENDPDATLVATAMKSSGLTSVAILDGGLRKWTEGNGPVTVERKVVAQARPGPELQPAAGVLAPLDEVKQAVEGKNAVVLDVRPAEQYEAGHIPGSVNRPWKQDLVAEGQPNAGSAKSREALEKEYASLGVTKDTKAIVYCNSGHMASEVFYTLRYRLGYDKVKLYDGSWLEWSMTPGLPKETGPAKSAPGGKTD